MTILEEAANLVGGKRQEAYGHPSVIYERVGRVWGAFLDIPDIPAEKVCLMLAGMKAARESVIPKHDNRVDIAGYAETVNMCVAKRVELEEEKPSRSPILAT